MHYLLHLSHLHHRVLCTALRALEKLVLYNDRDYHQHHYLFQIIVGVFLVVAEKNEYYYVSTTHVEELSLCEFNSYDANHTQHGS